MPDIITEVHDRGCGGEYRIRRNRGQSFSVYAKDELDAYNKGMAFLKEEEKEMRVITMCVTMVILFLLSSITFACESKGERYTNNMKHCIAKGKNYVSEYEGYSCREAAATPPVQEVKQ